MINFIWPCAIFTMKESQTLAGHEQGDEDSYDLRHCRVNFQCYVYCNYARKDAPPPPSHHGWTIIEAKIL